MIQAGMKTNTKDEGESGLVPRRGGTHTNDQLRSHLEPTDFQNGILELVLAK